MIEAKIKEREKGFVDTGYKSVEELDSIQKYGKPEEKVTSIEYWLYKKMLKVQEGRSSKEVKERFIESFKHNIPKGLFIYMPLFAFVLWLFQNKKKWYYFDHGIFTLHYFSFLLLGTLIITLINSFLGMFDFWAFSLLNTLIRTVIICYMLYYFFRHITGFISNPKPLPLPKELLFLSSISLF